MPSEQMRSLLLRVLFDDNFHNLMLTVPQKAMESYKLTEDEKNLLSRPSTSIDELLQSQIGVSEDLLGSTRRPPTTTTTYCVTTTYCATTTSSCATKTASIDSAVIKPLVDSIRQSSDAERFERILHLVNQFTG